MFEVLLCGYAWRLGFRRSIYCSFFVPQISHTISHAHVDCLKHSETCGWRPGVMWSLRPFSNISRRQMRFSRVWWIRFDSRRGDENHWIIINDIEPLLNYYVLYVHSWLDTSCHTEGQRWNGSWSFWWLQDMQSLLFLEDVPPARWLGNWCVGVAMSNSFMFLHLFHPFPQSCFWRSPTLANFVTLPRVFIQHVLQYMLTALMGCIDPATAHRQACRLSRQIAPEQRQEWVVGMAMGQNSSKFI